MEVFLNIMTWLLVLCILPTGRMVYKKKMSFVGGVFMGTFLLLVSFCFSIYGVSILRGYNPIDYMVGMVAEVSKTALASAGIGGDAINAYVNMISASIPSVLILASLFWSYVILMLIKGILAIFRRDVSGFARFCDFKMPKTALFLACITYLISIFVTDGYVGYGCMNFSSIILSVTAFCGLSVIDYGVRKKIRFSLLRFGIYFVALFLLEIFGLGTTILTFAGFTDAAFNFRNPFIRIKRD